MKYSTQIRATNHVHRGVASAKQLPGLPASPAASAELPTERATVHATVQDPDQPAPTPLRKQESYSRTVGKALLRSHNLHRTGV